MLKRRYFGIRRQVWEENIAPAVIGVALALAAFAFVELFDIAEMLK